MGNYRDHPAIKEIRNANFPRFKPELWCSEFVEICHALPVRLPGGGKKKVAITRYKSGTGGGAYKRAGLLRGQLQKNPEVQKDKHAINWLDVSKQRVRMAFCGHATLEELSLLFELALKAGLVSVDRLQNWIDQDQEFGLDCNGFTNAYYTAIGSFLENPIHYHNKYKQIAGVAHDWYDIDYDSVILWARPKASAGDKKDLWEVIPNGQKGPDHHAHIGVIDHVLNDEVVVCQHGSNVGPRISTYKIISELPSKKKGKEVWHLREIGKSAEQTVILTKTMPTYAAGE